MNRLAIFVVLAILTPMLATLVSIPAAFAQLYTVTITNVYTPAPNGVYPGEPIIVEVNVGLSTPFTIYVANALDLSIIYASQYVPNPQTGKMNVTMTIPFELPGLSQAQGIIQVYVVPGFGDTYYYIPALNVYPKIVVTPNVATLVDPYNVPTTFTAKIYGVYESNSVESIELISGSTTYSIPVTNGVPDANGVVTYTFTLYGPDSQFPTGIPMGTYTVTFHQTDDTFYDLYRTATLTVMPQVVYVYREGFGICTDLPKNGITNDVIELIGVGFPANAAIDTIRLNNTNFTLVHYDFTVNMSTDENGYFATNDLLQISCTNLTAGLYIPTVILADNTSYTFRNAYYLVRPILLFLVNGELYREYPGVVMPGDTITIVAFGYSPGKEWYGVDNILGIYLDKVTFLVSGPLGKDGNGTFIAAIPLNTTWGSHYIHGVDSRTYEYSVAIVVGAKAIFRVVLRPESYKVTASYNNIHVTICPCAEYVGKTFCDTCVIYTGDCDYVGDYIEVKLFGLQPGEKLTELYLNDILVPAELINGTLVADENGIMTFWFLVPTIPEGQYTIRVVTQVSGEKVAVWEKNVNIDYVQVVPKIALVTLDSDVTGGKGTLPILLGSGIVKVIGTGFTPGLYMSTILVNNTDALRAITTNVGTWTVDERGVIVAGKIAGEPVTPAVWFPLMQPGKYEVRLVYYVGAELSKSEPGYVYVVNNLTFVATKDDLATVVNAVNSSVSTLGSKIDAINGQLAAISGALANVATKSDLAAAKTEILNALANVATKNDVSSATTTITQAINSAKTEILNKISEIKLNVDLTPVLNAISDVKNAVLETKGIVTSIEGKVNTISSDMGAVKTKADDVATKVDAASATATNSMYVGVLALIFALLAMIFALLGYITIKKSVAPK